MSVDMVGLQTDSALCPFTHTVGNVRYQGCFRPVVLDCIDVFAVGLIKTVALDDRAPTAAACDTLEELVLIRQRLGWPVFETTEAPELIVDAAASATLSLNTG